MGPKPMASDVGSLLMTGTVVSTLSIILWINKLHHAGADLESLWRGGFDLCYKWFLCSISQI